eukprot:m.133404 g.133404  ORF g.133404 m.133404 type:complete len:116 (+) comp52409_c0_seq2:277-624(+)
MCSAFPLVALLLLIVCVLIAPFFHLCAEGFQDRTPTVTSTDPAPTHPPSPSKTSPFGHSKARMQLARVSVLGMLALTFVLSLSLTHAAPVAPLDVLQVEHLCRLAVRTLLGVTAS